MKAEVPSGNKYFIFGGKRAGVVWRRLWGNAMVISKL